MAVNISYIDQLCRKTPRVLWSCIAARVSDWYLETHVDSARFFEQFGFERGEPVDDRQARKLGIVERTDVVMTLPAQGSASPAGL